MAALGVKDLISTSHPFRHSKFPLTLIDGVCVASHECCRISESQCACRNECVRPTYDPSPPFYHSTLIIWHSRFPVVVVDDHIAFPLMTGLNPLRGPVSRPGAARFVPMSDAYSRSLRLGAFRAAHALDLGRSALAEGTYAWVSGPTYETRGEAALLAAAGASVVGMSTVPEVVAARDEGVRVLVLSLVTNLVVGIAPGTGGRSVREEFDAEVRYVVLGRLGVICHVLVPGLARRDSVGTAAHSD